MIRLLTILKVVIELREMLGILRHTLEPTSVLETFFSPFFNGLILGSLGDQILKVVLHHYNTRVYPKADGPSQARRDSVNYKRKVPISLYWHKGCQSTLQSLELVALLALALIIAVNVLARTFLLVESFIALPNSPSSVYQSPRWTVYVPHI